MMSHSRTFAEKLRQYRSDARTVYLIHLAQPIVRSNGVRVRHYAGSTDDLTRRTREHRSGQNGSPLLNLANQRGIAWEIAATWEATRDLERYLKRSHHLQRYCPICRKAEGREP